MLRIFRRFPLHLLMRMISFLSLAIFILVIGTNYVSIGSVQEMNERLQNGPLSNKATWGHLVNRVAEAETIRLQFQIAPLPATAQLMTPLMSAAEQTANSMDGIWGTMVRESLTRYREAFAKVVMSAKEIQENRNHLLTAREKLETLVYEAEVPSLEGALQNLLITETAYLGTSDEDRSRSLLVILDQLSRDSANTKNAKGISDSIRTYRGIFEKILENNLDMFALSLDMADVVEKISQSAHEGANDADKMAEESVRQARATVTTTQRLALLWTIIGVVIAIVLSELFHRLLRQQVETTIGGLKKLADGDLRHRFLVDNNARNEIFRIMSNTDTMTDKFASLQGTVIVKANAIDLITQEFIRLESQLLQQADAGGRMVKKVSEQNAQMEETTKIVLKLSELGENQTRDAADAAVAFSNIVQQVAAASEEASANVVSMATTAEMMLEKVSDVRRNIERVNESVMTVASAVEEMDATMGEVGKRCQEADSSSKVAGQSVETANLSLRNLDTVTGDISNVVAMIRHIADQTNMLALNAAIEAAGAGEAGKGFAVVANEVKGLAKETANATRLISEKIDEIQKVTHKADEAMKHVVTHIHQVIEVNTEITHAMVELSQASKNITLSIFGVSQSSDAVTRNMVELETSTQDVSRSASSAAQSTDEITRMAAKAADRAKQIAANADKSLAISRDINTKTDIIFSSVEEVRSTGIQLLENIGQLNNVAGKVAEQSAQLQKGSQELELATKGFVI